MNKYILLSNAAFLLLISACKNTSAPVTKQLPKPGTIVASAEMPVVEDTLNKFTFGVKVSADSAVADGVYNVAANYEYHTNESKFSMPKGGEDFKPVIRKGKEPYTYIIGFKIEGDTTFYDYFQVSATNSDMKMGYIKAYTFGSK